ncbi:PAS domain S-box protein [Geomonas sp. RF6]|uniref:PAS domain S-box protein n=1 Tax=Geomonas sp. RF6 TaxID=2897342 RepID=UPI001E61A802|nr:PAS domain S-box protein [Geomonas sp. RF6]UFS70776.1 PAS domain S-box protein [Geomonas sp. RF6]
MDSTVAASPLMATILDSIPIPIFFKDEHGRYLSCNTSYESFFGISRQEMAGKTVHELFAPSYADKFREMDLQLYNTPGVQMYEGRVLNADAENREVIFHKATFCRPDGEIAGIVGVVLDSTQLKETEKKLLGVKTSFNRIFDAIPDLVSVVDRDLRIIYSNWNGGFDYVPEEVRASDCHCYEAYYPEQGKPCDECHLEKVFSTGRPVVTEKYNPRVGYLEIYAFPVLDDDGTVIMATEYLRNINSRKKAADALRQANHILEAIINASPLAIIALDSDINLTLWNDAAEEMFGWKREEVLYKPYPIVPEDRDGEVLKNVRQLNKGKVCRAHETQRKKKDGTLIDVSLSTAVMPGPDGGTIGYMAILSDITENKRAQRELRESEANYRAIFDAANDAIFVLDVETGNILDVNRKLCEMYGYSREETLLLTIEDLSAGEGPYNQENALKQIRKARDNVSHLFEWIAKDRSGRRFWVEVNMRGAVLRGKQRALAVVRDITERKEAMEALRESEERFRQIFEEDEDAALILAPATFAIVDANAAAVRMFGHTKKEIRKSPLSFFMSEEEFHKVSETFLPAESVTETRSRTYRIDRVAIVSRNGKELVTSVRGKIMRSQGNNYIYCTFRDITEKLRLKEERKRIEEKLLQTNKMTALGTLASGIAHEINNPNNYILSTSQFLHEAWKDIEQILMEYGRENGEFTIGGLPDKEAGEVIPKLLVSLEEGSVRIKNIVEGLKNFARQEKQPYRTVIDVNMAVRASVNLLGNQIRKYTDNFFCTLDENVPKVEGSFQQIEQVILNLTINALQSLPNKNSGVYLSTFYDRKAHQVWIRVRDQGTGIPRELQSRIMEPFFTTRSDQGGTGLGLSICYSIIKKHQGTIEYESDLRLGTTFTVRLPVYGAKL